MQRSHKKVEPIYPLEQWAIVEEQFRTEHNLRNETVFSLGNGYLGLRGTFEEGYAGPEGTSVEGTYINGFYDTVELKYPEVAHGYPEKSQTMLNLTNGKLIKLYLEDEECHLFSGEVLAYRRSLDLKNGVLQRNLVWRSPAGQEIDVKITRLVSLTNKHLAAIAYEITPINFSGKLRLFSALDGDIRNLQAEKDPRVGSHFKDRVLEMVTQSIDKEGGALLQKTKNTGFYLACAMRNQTEGRLAKVETVTEPFMVGASYEFIVERGKTVRFFKYLAYVTAKGRDPGLLTKAETLVTGAQQAGFNHWQAEQQAYLADFWEQVDITIEGDPLVQQGLRFNAFHLLQAVGKDGVTSIGAKGLTGEGYEGHYFWDTEIYILPFFLSNDPSIGKALLLYRYHTLEAARQRAREIGLSRGALYPWRTIGGAECSPFFPAGTAQYHINADIAYAIKKYMEFTDDQEFLLTCGAEILAETARLWMEIGVFNPRKGHKFCINVVTGPDEYTALVDNNSYTNLMAKEHLSYAYQTVVWMKVQATDSYQSLCAKIGLSEEEIKLWHKAAKQMYLPYDRRLGILAQDDTFLEKPVWDLEATPADKFPLLLHYHPLLIYRAQVCKQPDVVLALFLLGKRFSIAQKKRNYDYYERITTHDSSLSPSIFSIIAAEISYYQKAYAYFQTTVRLDLDDYNGNTKDGIHTACLGGSWLCVVYGFAGMRVENDSLSFAPYLPEHWEEYSFKITYQKRRIKVTVNKKGTSYRLLQGEPLIINHYRQKRLLTDQRQLLLSKESFLCWIATQYIVLGCQAKDNAKKPKRGGLSAKKGAVIFDLDGVIVSTDDCHYRAWKRLADEEGIYFDFEINRRLRGISRMESLNIILEKASRAYSAEEKKVLAERKNKYYRKLIQQLTPEDILPGIKLFLEQLKRKKIKIAIGSSSKNAPLILERLGLNDYFDAVVDGNDLTKSKPDPQVFLLAAKRLGVPPEHCVVVEDADAGVEAALAAGMRVVGVGTAAANRWATLRVNVLDSLSWEKVDKMMEGIDD